MWSKKKTILFYVDKTDREKRSCCIAVNKRGHELKNLAVIDDDIQWKLED